MIEIKEVLFFTIFCILVNVVQVIAEVVYAMWKKGEGKTTVGKKFAVVISAAVVVLLVIFCVGRYGWKLAGFSACQNASIESVEVTDREGTITGTYPGTFPEGFIGYISEESEGTLCVGFRFSRVFGFFEPGDFEITIPVKEEIQQVFIRAGTSEYPIWPEPETGDSVPEPVLRYNKNTNKTRRLYYEKLTNHSENL